MLRMPSVLALGVLWLMHPASRKMRSLALGDELEAAGSRLGAMIVVPMGENS